ncbi:MAG: hypothetical protein KGI58_02110 [Patescibacteria group bacterium]|nr:hypothetical protein [Patescibacteria group bacterium]
MYRKTIHLNIIIMETTDIRKKLISPKLLSDQISITEIPKKIYEHFYTKRISEEIKRIESDGKIRLWYRLQIKPEYKNDQVIASFIKRDDGDAIETRFTLMTWYPPLERFGDPYDFEIFSNLQSRGWSHNDGNRFIEVLSYRTNTINNHAIEANHSLTDYVAMALIEMRNLLMDKKIVQQEFIDNSPSHIVNNSAKNKTKV